MAAKVPRETIDEVCARTDLVALVGTRVALKRSGGLLKGCCPFHQEKTPSFVVYPDDHSFHCFGCQAHGNAIDFVMRTEGLPFMEALQQLARQTGIELATEDDPQAELRSRLIALHESLSAFYRRCLQQAAEAQAARVYLQSRTLDERVGDAFLIGYAPRRTGALVTWAQRNNWPLRLLVQAGLLVPNTPRAQPERERRDSTTDYYDRFKGRLMFPIRDPRGRVVAFSGRLLEDRKRAAKYVNSPESLIFHKGRILYGLDRARRVIVGLPHREALLCEGQIDVIRCHASGFENAVAAQGTAFTAEHAVLLSRYADSAVLVFDADAAGRKAALRTAMQLMAAGMPVRIAELPSGEDPDSFLRAQPPEAFRQRLSDAESVVPFQVRLLRTEEARPDAVDAVERIAGAVLETVAAASSAILRARLLQEAAEHLNLPESALNEVLTARLARQRSAAPRPPAESNPLPTPQTAPDTNAAPTSDDLPEDIPEDVSPATPHPKPSASIPPPCPEAIALCELVCQHEDAPAVLLAIEDYLPLVFVPHPVCRRILEAAIETRHTGKDRLVELQETDPKDLGKWISRFATAAHRVAGARETTPETAAHGCILGLWRRQLGAERRDLDQTDGAAPETLRERWILTTLMNRLKMSEWATVHPLLTEEIHRRHQDGRLAPPAEHAAESVV